MQTVKRVTESYLRHEGTPEAQLTYRVLTRVGGEGPQHSHNAPRSLPRSLTLGSKGSTSPRANLSHTFPRMQSYQLVLLDVRRRPPGQRPPWRRRAQQLW
ncbi:hypothetical protein E2C01_035518 [Portunus trituberculatus]|uniref:Uncharacterized protein n=1 Tax=Portunus trituberculatus TaxID=210409 RepID=A0A5B7F9J6_PORTR|nr:hypothetical protein [Portunus trituberculatus]